MTQIGKTGVVVCTQCGEPCAEERISYNHTKEGKEVNYQFCSEECRNELLGINDLVITRVDHEVRKELNLLHKYVCPSCIRRLMKFI